jgi:hypothetical protein
VSIAQPAERYSRYFGAFDASVDRSAETIGTKLDRFVPDTFASACTKPEDFIRITALDAAGKLTESGSYSFLAIAQRNQ